MEKEQLEAIDLIINVLREHEKNLENLLDRLDTLIEVLSTTMARLRARTRRSRRPPSDPSTWQLHKCRPVCKHFSERGTIQRGNTGSGASVGG